MGTLENYNLETLNRKINDEEVYQIIKDELKRQQEHIDLIASENRVPEDIEACMSYGIFSTKYSEGSSHKRYYSGCENIDKIEDLIDKYSKEIIHPDYNCFSQFFSGSQANTAIYDAIIHSYCIQPILEIICKENGKKPNLNNLTRDEINALYSVMESKKPFLLSLDISMGSHLTHGSKTNLSSRLFNVVNYSLTDSNEINYREIEDKIINIMTTTSDTVICIMVGYSAFEGRINFGKIKHIQNMYSTPKHQIILFADFSHFAGFVVSHHKDYIGDYSPFDSNFDVCMATTHKMLLGGRGSLCWCNNDKIWQALLHSCPHLIGGQAPNVTLSKLLMLKHFNTKEYKDYIENININAKALCEGLELNHTIWAHQVLINLPTDYGINCSGLVIEHCLYECGISVNRNTVKNDTRGSWYTSGLRLGTNYMTYEGKTKDWFIRLGMIMKEMIFTINDCYLKLSSDNEKVTTDEIVTDFMNKYGEKYKAEVKNLLSKN